MGIGTSCCRSSRRFVQRIKVRIRSLCCCSRNRNTKVVKRGQGRNKTQHAVSGKDRVPSVRPHHNKKFDSSIFPRLPNDVALQCLARVPRVYHHHLRTVSPAWSKSIDSQEFLRQRHLLRCSEDWLYFHIGTSPRLDGTRVGKRKRWQLIEGYSRWHTLDLGRHNWYALPPIPYDPSVTRGQVILGASSAVLGKKLYVVGGAPFGRSAIRDVWVYDPRKNSWEKAAPMSVARFCCLVGVINNKLYVVGGSSTCSLTSYSLPYLEIYDPATNSWTHAASAQGAFLSLPFNPLKHVAVLDGSLYVVGSQNSTGRLNGGRYDPAMDTWSDIKPGLQSGWGKPSTVVDGKLCVADFNCYKQYDPNGDSWLPIRCQSGELFMTWDPRLISSLSSSKENIYLVSNVHSALIVVIIPIKDGKCIDKIRFETLKLPHDMDLSSGFGNFSGQILCY